MRRLVPLPVALALSALTPLAAVAEEGVPRAGAVAGYVQAVRLSAQGVEEKDPLLVLAAARLLHGIGVEVVDRPPEGGSVAAEPLAVPEVAGLLETARALDTGGRMADLIDLMQREVPPETKRLDATTVTLEAGKEAVWTLPFYGGAFAELAILGDGQANLDLTVTGPDKAVICDDRGRGDVSLCGFVLTDNADVIVTVRNAGATLGRFVLLTE